MNFTEALKYVHRESWAFTITCPLIIAIPVLAELAQHWAEIQAGMYDGLEGAQASENDPQRMVFGYVKTLALVVVGYSVIRFLHGGRDKSAAYRLELRAIGFFAVVFALQALLSYLSLFVFTGMDPVAIGFLFFGIVLSPLVARFIAAAPLGVWISPLASARQMWRQIIWALVFNLIAVLPLMTLHYALGLGAIFAPEWAQWPMLITDSLIVGWLAALLAAISWTVAIRKEPPAELLAAKL